MYSFLFVCLFCFYFVFFFVFLINFWGTYSIFKIVLFLFNKKADFKTTKAESYVTHSYHFLFQLEIDSDTVADPGFPIGGADLVGGRQLPRRLCFEKFVCQNERIWTLRGARAGGAPWIRQCDIYCNNCKYYPDHNKFLGIKLLQHAVTDPGFPGGANSRGSYVSKNLYVKTIELHELWTSRLSLWSKRKNLDPWGARRQRPLDPHWHVCCWNNKIRYDRVLLSLFLCAQ